MLQNFSHNGIFFHTCCQSKALNEFSSTRTFCDVSLGHSICLSSSCHTGSAHPRRTVLTLVWPNSPCAGTCPAPPRDRALCWTRRGARSVCGGWWRCKSPRRPASPPSSARSWSSGTPNTTPGPVYSSRWSTGDNKQCKQSTEVL